MRRQYWTGDDIKQLKNLYETDGLDAQQISIILHRSEDAIKVKIVRLKLRHSKEQTFKIKSKNTSGKNNPMFSRLAWSNGLTKNTDERLNNGSFKISNTRKEMFKDGILLPPIGKLNPMFGKPSWNNGLTKETDKRVKLYGFRISKTKKEQWKNLSEEEKNKKRLYCAKIGSQKKCITSIELKIHDFLNHEKIKFIAGHPIGYYVCDIYIPMSNLIIECQGDYWHGNPNKYNELNMNLVQKKNIRRDKSKLTYLKNRGFNQLNIWEYDIRFNFNLVKEIIKNKIKDCLVNTI